jgi:microcystin-dependent protein
MENLKISDGVDAGYIKNSGIPVGSIIMSAGTSYSSTISNGRCPCDGRSLSTSEYPELFNVIGYTYGGSGGSFNVPKLMPDLTVGSNNTVTFNEYYISGRSNQTLGSSAGSTTHNHSLPPTTSPSAVQNTSADDHYHTINTRTATPITGAHNHNYTTGAMALGNPPNPTSSKTDGNASAAGAGHLHNSPSEAVTILSQVNTTNSVTHNHNYEGASNSNTASRSVHSHTGGTAPTTNVSGTIALNGLRMLYYIKL